MVFSEAQKSELYAEVIRAKGAKKLDKDYKKDLEKRLIKYVETSKDVISLAEYMQHLQHLEMDNLLKAVLIKRIKNREASSSKSMALVSGDKGKKKK
ncbi:unnamed protein product [Cochlearia groenlandica]